MTASTTPTKGVRFVATKPGPWMRYTRPLHRLHGSQRMDASNLESWTTSESPSKIGMHCILLNAQPRTLPSGRAVPSPRPLFTQQAVVVLAVSCSQPSFPARRAGPAGPQFWPAAAPEAAAGLRRRLPLRAIVSGGLLPRPRTPGRTRPAARLPSLFESCGNRRLP